ncbi:hypothetical protein AB0C59_20165 [Streptomyces sp. NPDC048664]|uniref:hypothetical protein n=1 Tax=Streptomyces sp. NPDC048664 TaxID=3154505 RepID=UPI0034343153
MPTMTVDDTPARLRLHRALDRLEVTFRGMTARSDETQCVCHWGDEEELAQLKIPDVALDPDLLRRTWNAPDWDDHGAVLRRVLPQFARALVGGLVEPTSGMEEVGRSFARGHWRRWPTPQSAAVREFLHAWWAHTLDTPDPAVPVRSSRCAPRRQAHSAPGSLPGRPSNTASPSGMWPKRLLTGSTTCWVTNSPGRHGTTQMPCAPSSRPGWSVTPPTRLRALDVPEELLHRIRLIGLTGPARWEDPHWPNRRY